jgi:uncharacterized protein (DUF305 family)
MASPASALPLAKSRLVAVLLFGVAAGAVLALLLSSGARADDSAEAGFARDMATHHAQAVEMSFVIRDKSSDESLRTLAYDIIVTQATQRGVFMGWLQEWNLPQTSTASRMSWMPGHAHEVRGPDGGVPLMPGMASDGELRRLRESSGPDAEVLFLQLMIRHHEGGVVMANAVEGLSRRAEVLGMAKSIRDGQRAEIAAMTEMLAKRDARPFASLLE